MILFTKEKIGVIFFIRKKTIPGGGPRGGLAKDHRKYVFFSEPFPYEVFFYDFTSRLETSKFQEVKISRAPFLSEGPGEAGMV